MLHFDIYRRGTSQLLVVNLSVCEVCDVNLLTDVLTGVWHGHGETGRGVGRERSGHNLSHMSDNITLKFQISMNDIAL